MNGCGAMSKPAPTKMKTIASLFGLRIAGLLCACLALAGAAKADSCRDETFEQLSFTVCQAEAGQDLRLFLSDAAGGPLGSFDAVNTLLGAQGQTLIFAMNAGMYHPDYRPVGLYVEDGEEIAHLQTREGPGNFGLLPNGVFCITGDGFQVIEARAFAMLHPACRFATQSGPMLVIDGKLHPKFLPTSDSRNIRNGVGVSADGKTAYLVISNGLVNFDLFARFFRDRLSTPNALFLDGTISRLYAPELGRNDFGFRMGPIIGLVGKSG